jgi:TetR/AcrR family transcriptional repressor of nem operon
VGRNRTFDEAQVVERAARQFLLTGYEATSVDDLVAATGLHRGSLYQAFGSKRGLFLAALERLSRSGTVTTDSVDLLLVALLELAPVDVAVRDVTRRILATMPAEEVALILGSRLLTRAGIDRP